MNTRDEGGAAEHQRLVAAVVCGPAKRGVVELTGHELGAEGAIENEDPAGKSVEIARLHTGTLRGIWAHSLIICPQLEEKEYPWTLSWPSRRCGVSLRTPRSPAKPPGNDATKSTGPLAIAGTALDRAQLDALLDRGIAEGGHQLDNYIAARDVAAASVWVAEQRPIAVADPRPLITVEDIRRLHTLATAGRPDYRPGVWRLRVDPPAAGVVFPPPWLIAKETAALVERFRRRPPTRDIAVWLAAFLTRYARIRPFTGANGTAGRLAAALLLRRLDIVPLAISRDRVAVYSMAVSDAEIGNASALQSLIGEALLAGSRRLIAAAGTDPLVPLRELAGTHYAALIKAAKRGRLPVVVRDGRVYATAGWVEDYRSGRRSGSA